MEPGESEQDEATGSGGLARNTFRDYLTVALLQFMSTFLGFPEKRVTCCLSLKLMEYILSVLKRN